MLGNKNSIIENFSLRGLFFFAKFFLYNRRSVGYHKSLLRNQFLPPEELAFINWEKKKKLINFAYQHVPYYRKKFDEVGIKPADIATPKDYNKIPLLTKDDIRKNFNDLISDLAKKRHCKIMTTGGSTGVPLKLYHDKRTPIHLLGWRMLGWWGLQPWVDSAYVWRMTQKSALKNMINRILWWPIKHIMIDASFITIKSLGDFIKNFNRIRPRLLQGYTGSICQVASHIKNNNLKVHFPDVVWVTSSPISEVQRRLITDVFHAPVFTQYGCSEILWISAECKEHTGLHIFSDVRYVEFIDEDNNQCPTGEMGRIVITDLENYVFPLIRYINGDKGRSFVNKCSCGVSLPLMDYVKGRDSDNIILPDQSCLGGDYMTTIFDDFPEAVDEFQVYQKKDFSLIIFVVPNRDFNNYAHVLKEVQRTLEDKTDFQIPIEVKIVDNIEHDRGKARFIISEV